MGLFSKFLGTAKKAADVVSAPARAVGTAAGAAYNLATGRRAASITPSPTKAPAKTTYGPPAPLKQLESDRYRVETPVRFSQSPPQSTTAAIPTPRPTTIPRSGGSWGAPPTPQAAPAPTPTPAPAPAPPPAYTPQAGMVGGRQYADTGFAAPDDGTQARIRAMQQQVLRQSSMATPTPTPTPAPTPATPAPTAPPPTTAPTPAAPTGPSPEELARQGRMEELNRLRQSLMGTYGQSPEQQEAQRRLNEIIAQQANLAASEQMGLAGMSDQPIVMDLIRGQQQALQRQAQAQQGALTAQAKPIETQLADLQASRMAQREQAKMQLGFTQSDIEREDALRAAQAEAEAEQTKPIEIDGALVQYNPETGKYETLYKSPTSTKPVTLSQGQVLVDPVTGEQIAVGQAKDRALPAAAQEYQFATQTGFQGSFMDYLSAKQRAGQSVPSSFKEWQLAGQPGTYADYIQKKGQTTGRPLSGSETRLISEGNQLAQAVDPLRAIIDQQASRFGPVAGRAGQMNPYDTEAQAIDSQMRIASQTIGRYMEGGVLRKEDEDKYRKMLPQLTDTPEVAKAKLDQIEALLKSKQQKYIDDFSKAGFDVSAFQQGTQQTSGRTYTPQQQQLVNQWKSAGISQSDIDAALGFKTAGSTAQRGSTNLKDLGTVTVKYLGRTRYERSHPAIDFANKIGTPIPSNIGGTVVAVRTGKRQGDKGYGNYVRIRDSSGNVHYYNHLDSVNVKVGDFVDPGMVFAKMGNTGSTYSVSGGTGSHLDYRVKNSRGAYINPNQFVG